jgi:RNA polymerase sigma-70 factor, ECF subfamily
MELNLITRVQNQDESVIAHLYDAYGSALFGIVFRIVGKHDLAEQVLQDAFVKIWRNGPKYDATKGRLFTWMLNIARNTAIDAIRSAGYRQDKQTTGVDAGIYAMQAETPDPHLMDVRDIVQRLDEKYRIIVQKIYFEGYSHADLSDELDIPIGTIKTRLRAAIQELRQHVGPETAGIIAMIATLTDSLA